MRKARVKIRGASVSYDPDGPCQEGGYRQVRTSSCSSYVFKDDPFQDHNKCEYLLWRRWKDTPVGHVLNPVVYYSHDFRTLAQPFIKPLAFPGHRGASWYGRAWRRERRRFQEQIAMFGLTLDADTLVFNGRYLIEDVTLDNLGEDSLGRIFLLDYGLTN